TSCTSSRIAAAVGSCSPVTAVAFAISVALSGAVPPRASVACRTEPPARGTPTAAAGFAAPRACADACRRASAAASGSGRGGAGTSCGAVSTVVPAGGGTAAGYQMRASMRRSAPNGAEKYLLEQPRVQVNLRARQRLRHGTVPLGIERILVKSRLVNARNVGLGLQLDPGDGKPLADPLQRHLRTGVNARRREARPRKLRGQCHREAPGVGSADQLLRVGRRLAFFKSGFERIRPVKGAAAHSQPPAAFGEIALPFRFCLPCWHGASLRCASVTTANSRP